MELLALGGLVAAGLAMDLFVLEIWLSIASETYARLAGIVYAWTFFGLIALIVSTGGPDVVPTGSPVPISSFGDESLLRPLRALLVVIATLWFATLAATRVVKTSRRHTLKRMFRTSPSSIW